MKAMRTMALTVLLGSLPACVAKETKVRLKVEVKTNQGEPVHAASVQLDGKTLGTTSNAGLFHGDVNLPAGAKKRLEVHKDSDTYYFAPYYQAFEVDSAGPQELAVAATLYFVPKPAPAGGKAAAVAGVAASAPAAAGGADTAAATTATGVAATAAATAATAGSPTEAERATTAAVPTADAASGAAVASAGDSAKTAAKPQAEGEGAASSVASLGPPRESAAETQAKQQAAALAEHKREIAKAVPGSRDRAPEPDAGLDLATPAASAIGVLPAAPAGEPAGLPKSAALTVDKPVDKSPGKGGELAPETASYAASAHPNVGSQLFTVHVYGGANPLGGVDVAMGEGDSSSLKTACTTNERGRCVIRFTAKPEALVTFVAAKKGFKTAVVTVPVQSKDKLRINLDVGRSLDIYALTQAYGHRSGLGGVEVRVGAKRVGETDRFGRYSYIFASKADDLLTVSLKPKGFLPEVFETDFVTGGELQLIKTFTPDQPPSVRMTVLSPLPAGSVDKDTLAELGGAFAEAVRAAARRHLYASTAFKEYPFALYDQAVHRAGKTTGEVLRTGWQDSDLKSVVDAVLVPTVVTGATTTLELSIVDSRGHVLSAAKEELSGMSDKGAVDRAVAAIAKKITRAFPFEGAVLSKSAQDVTINLGQGQGRDVQVGDLLDVYGQQAAKLGRSQLHGKIATLKVRAVDEKTATATVTTLAPRSTIERGDLVMLRPRKEQKEPRFAPLLVMTELSGKRMPVAQANLYLNNSWLGATDSTGRLYVDGKPAGGKLKVIKQGFADLTQNVQLGDEAGKPQVLTLKRQAAFLRIDSRPSAAVVKVEGKILGKTPLAAPIPVPSGFVKMEVEGPAGYKTYSTVLELDQGTLDLTGEAAIALEQDLLAVAQRLVKVGKTEAALAVLNQVPPEHSDFLMARHQAGELYLTVLDEPAKAAEAFGQVTATPAVKQFVDKRFIGSRIDEGIALFLTAERLGAEKPEAAQAHYSKALEVLDSVIPYLRFVPQGEYAQAVHNVDYHRALCRHRLWSLTQDPRLLVDTVKSWKSYLDGSARAVPAEGPSKAYVENAAVYLKQAAASLNAARNVSRQ